jgi:MoxR-like ATPase
MLSVHMSYPAREDEARILQAYVLPDGIRGNAAPAATLEVGAVANARAELANVHMSEALIGYVLDIVASTRQSSNIGLGLSSRAALALARCARIEAAIRGADFVIPDDVKQVAPWVMPHRVVMTTDAVLEGVSAAGEVQRILDSVAVPRDSQ